MMRILAIILNAVSLLVIAFVALTENIHLPYDFIGWIILLLVISVPTVNLLTLWVLLLKASSKSLLSLYLERKKLEEQTKIDKLKTLK